MKRYSTSLVIGKMQTKPTMSCHYTHKRLAISSIGWNVEQLELTQCYWECKIVQLLQEEFTKVKIVIYHMIQQCQSQVRNESISPQTDVYRNVYSKFIHNSQKLETTQMSLMDKQIYQYICISIQGNTSAMKQMSYCCTQYGKISK